MILFDLLAIWISIDEIRINDMRSALGAHPPRGSIILWSWIRAIWISVRWRSEEIISDLVMLNDTMKEIGCVGEEGKRGMVIIVHSALI